MLQITALSTSVTPASLTHPPPAEPKRLPEEACATFRLPSWKQGSYTPRIHPNQQRVCVLFLLFHHTAPIPWKSPCSPLVHALLTISPFPQLSQYLPKIQTTFWCQWWRASSHPPQLLFSSCFGIVLFLTPRDSKWVGVYNYALNSKYFMNFYMTTQWNIDSYIMCSISCPTFPRKDTLLGLLYFWCSFNPALPLFTEMTHRGAGLLQKFTCQELHPADSRCSTKTTEMWLHLQLLLFSWFSLLVYLFWNNCIYSHRKK